MMRRRRRRRRMGGKGWTELCHDLE